MSQFFVGFLFGFMIGFALGIIIIGTVRICEWVKRKINRAKERRVKEKNKKKGE